MTRDPYQSRRWFFVWGRSGEIKPVRRAWGIQWRGGFIGVLFTEREEQK
jgi:hypothetical protein